jgi:hypothetical protein
MFLRLPSGCSKRIITLVFRLLFLLPGLAASKHTCQTVYPQSIHDNQGLLLWIVV